MRQLLQVGLLALLLITPLVGRAEAAVSKGPVHHVVIVWMDPAHRNPAAIDALIAGHEMLRAIPGLVALSVGRAIASDRPIVDDSYDVAAVFTFESVQAMQAYIDHPLHKEFLDRHTAGKVARVVVYDF